MIESERRENVIPVIHSHLHFSKYRRSEIREHQRSPESKAVYGENEENAINAAWREEYLDNAFAFIDRTINS